MRLNLHKVELLYFVEKMGFDNHLSPFLVHSCHVLIKTDFLSPPYSVSSFHFAFIFNYIIELNKMSLALVFEVKIHLQIKDLMWKY